MCNVPYHLKSQALLVTVQEGGASCDLGRAVTLVNCSPLTELIVLLQSYFLNGKIIKFWLRQEPLERVL